MGRMSGAPDRFGPRRGREACWIHYNHRIDFPPGVVHEVDKHLHVARAVRSFLLEKGRGEAPGPDGEDWLRSWRLPLPPTVAAFGEEALGRTDTPVVALCPSGRWESKRWPVESWARLASELRAGKPRLRPILVCGEAERPEAAEIAALAGDESPLEAWVGRTDLWQTASLFTRCAAVVCVDSLPLHLAWSLGVPTVALFGPSTPDRVGPRGDVHEVLRRGDLDCIGCWKHDCPLPEWRCMPGLDPSDVAGAVRRVRRWPPESSCNA